MRLVRVVSLERELNAQPQRGRELEDCTRTVEWVGESVRRYVGHTGNTAVNGKRLIQANRPLPIEDVEPIGG